MVIYRSAGVRIYAKMHHRRAVNLRGRAYAARNRARYRYDKASP